MVQALAFFEALTASGLGEEEACRPQLQADPEVDTLVVSDSVLTGLVPPDSRPASTDLRTERRPTRSARPCLTVFSCF